MGENELKNFIVALGGAKGDLEELANETQELARTILTATASDTVLDSHYGQDVIDTFAYDAGSLHEEDVVDGYKDKFDKDSSENYSDNKEFSKLAKEYDVTDKITGDDTNNVQQLYAAMKGIKVDEIDEDIASDVSKMLEEIAYMSYSSDRSDKMNQYVIALENIAKDDTKGGKAMADNLAGLFSKDGLGMDIDFINTLLKKDKFDKAQLELYAEAFGGMEAWADMLNLPVEKLYQYAEDNARHALKVNKKTFGELERVLKKEENTIT
jgi:hypothetical protein